MQTTKLPADWRWATIGEIADTTSGGTPSRGNSAYFAGTIPWVKSGELNDSIVTCTEECISEEAIRNSSAKVFLKGTPLVALYGATVGRTGILGMDAATNQAICAIMPHPSECTVKYIVWWLQSQRENLISLSAGGAQRNISQAIVRAYPIPLAPVSEQQSIVDAIETQLTRLDAAVAALKRVQANLRRYRAAVLKAACEGRLVPTEAELAQVEGRAYEPAAALLERILAERRAKWQASHPGKKYKEPAGPDVSGLPELPEGWCWATVEQLAAAEPNSITDGPFGSNLKTEHYTGDGPRVIRLQNIGDGQFIDEYAHISHSHFEKLLRHQVLAGDIVIAALGTELPRACIVPDFVGPAIVKADCIRFKADLQVAHVEFVHSALNSRTVKSIAASIIHGVGRPRLNQQEVKALPIPLPPRVEQDRIVEALQGRLSILAHLNTQLNQQAVRSNRLRRSILKRAFSGQLTEQDLPQSFHHEQLSLELS